LYRKVGGPRTFEDPVHVYRCPAIVLGGIRAISHEPSEFRESSSIHTGGDGGKSVLQREVSRAFGSEDRLDDQCSAALFGHRLKNVVELFTAPDLDGSDLYANAARGRPDLLEEQSAEEIRGAPLHQNRNLGNRGQRLRDQFQELATEIRRGRGKACDMSARSPEARDQPGSDGIAGRGHNDWDLAGCAFRSLDGRRGLGHDDVHPKSNEVRRETVKAISLSCCGPIVDVDVLPVDEPDLSQSLAEQWLDEFQIGQQQHADLRDLRLLRTQTSAQKRPLRGS